MLISVRLVHLYRPTATPPHKHTLKGRKNTHSTVQKHCSKVKNSSCEECGKRKKHCTPLKLRRKIQAMKIVIEQKDLGRHRLNIYRDYSLGDFPCTSHFLLTQAKELLSGFSKVFCGLVTIVTSFLHFDKPVSRVTVKHMMG